MAKKKKSYTSNRELKMVCLKHRDLWNKCSCKEGWKWVFLTDKELAIYRETGCVPDWKSEIYWVEGEPKPPWKDPTKQPPHDFVDKYMK